MEDENIGYFTIGGNHFRIGAQQLLDLCADKNVKAIHGEELTDLMRNALQANLHRTLAQVLCGAPPEIALSFGRSGPRVPACSCAALDH